jgi:uncharacterized protein
VPTATTPTQRRILRAFAALLIVGAALAIWAFVVEPDRLVVRREEIALPTRDLDGLRVALLADLHAGAPHVDDAKVAAVVAAINAERPDVVLLLGDYVIQGVVGGTFMAPERIAAHLGALRAPLGVWAVLGNHDHWLDGGRVTRALTAAGIRVLENEAARVDRGGRSLWLAGIDDLWTARPDVDRALAMVADDGPVLLFTHNPDLFPRVPARVALTLAGHTHGGQVDLPLLGPLVVPSDHGARYADGHVVEDGRHLFVSHGVGTSILPVRFRVPPEIVVLTLRAR